MSDWPLLSGLSRSEWWRPVPPSRHASPFEWIVAAAIRCCAVFSLCFRRLPATAQARRTATHQQTNLGSSTAVVVPFLRPVCALRPSLVAVLPPRLLAAHTSLSSSPATASCPRRPRLLAFGYPVPRLLFLPPVSTMGTSHIHSPPSLLARLSHPSSAMPCIDCTQDMLLACKYGIVLVSSRSSAIMPIALLLHLPVPCPTAVPSALACTRLSLSKRELRHYRARRSLHQLSRRVVLVVATLIDRTTFDATSAWLHTESSFGRSPLCA